MGLHYRLFLLKNNSANNNHNFYDSCVVIALDKEEAVTIKPSEDNNQWPQSQEDVSVVTLGLSNTDEPGKIVCSSYNA